MALGNVPKLHGLVGILAAVCALPLGCSDEFKGCEATRTCPSENDAGEGGDSGETGGSSGSGGASGGTTNTGGRSGSGSGGGSSGGSSGSAGNDDGGNGGDGGSGDDEIAPTIVSFTPGHGDSNVERDIAVTATFSEPIDAGTVTSQSVTLEGPDGAVTGTLGIDDNVISFAPDKPLNLLGTYTLTVTSSVADLAGNTLAQSESAEFRVRDGRWSAPTLPFGTTVSRVVTQFQRNAAGDAVLGIESQPPGTVYGAIYAAEANVWTEAAVVPGATGYARGVAIDSAKLAAMAWGGSDAFSWSRFSQGAWVNAGALGDSDPYIGTTGGGSATAVWRSDTGVTSRTLDLTDGSLEPAIFIGVFDRWPNQLWPVASLNRMALIVSRAIDNYTQEVSVRWKEGSSWSNPQPLASAQTEIPYVATDSDEQGNIVVVWRQYDELWARIYQRAVDQWIPAHLVGTTTSYAGILRPDITAGNAIVAADSLSATEGLLIGIYQAGVGWVEESVTHLDSQGNSFMALNVDSAGNALAVWHSELKYRRYVPGEGWQPPASLDANVDAHNLILAAGAPDGSVLVVANDLDANASGAPMAVRFE